MQFKDIKTPSDLKFMAELDGSLHFCRNNMKFAGDTMRNFGIRRHSNGQIIEIYRKHAVKHGLKTSSHWRSSECGTFAVRDYDWSKKQS